MATVKQIFESIDNAKVNYIMSAIPYNGRTVEQWNEVTEMRCELRQYVADGTLAAQLLESDAHLSVKQLWVIAYALEKSAEYCSKVDEINAVANAKRAASKAKIKANKEASNDVLAEVKAAGKLLKDYYAWLKASNYKREFFSKKYTKESVNAFLTK